MRQWDWKKNRSLQNKVKTGMRLTHKLSPDLCIHAGGSLLPRLSASSFHNQRGVSCVSRITTNQLLTREQLFLVQSLGTISLTGLYTQRVPRLVGEWRHQLYNKEFLSVSFTQRTLPLIENSKSCSIRSQDNVSQEFLFLMIWLNPGIEKCWELLRRTEGLHIP